MEKLLKGGSYEIFDQKVNFYSKVCMHYFLLYEKRPWDEEIFQKSE